MLFWLLVIGYRKLGFGYRTVRYPIGACAVQYPLSDRRLRRPISVIRILISE